MGKISFLKFSNYPKDKLPTCPQCRLVRPYKMGRYVFSILLKLRPNVLSDFGTMQISYTIKNGDICFLNFVKIVSKGQMAYIHILSDFGPINAD